ncbi:Uncharacterised protein [Mycobacteroides abscessus subsp. abscessus]|uniref:hypothetical protein n=1 Tax=Mycobacteroides abscessus TaxID=36809 RepID=UPI000926D6A8|nr:hypothetical protein [Mycobacteroides abscessus]SIC56080.1 Uncharacterised protein [Mycobacteroides abscessus subsp. abscessus]SKU57845.1 Uncharacterised protein [Mycobacteroides abscessus subsp. abscessus]
MSNPIIIPKQARELLTGTRRLLAPRQALAFVEQFLAMLAKRPELATLKITVTRDEHGITMRATPTQPG